MSVESFIKGKLENFEVPEGWIVCTFGDLFDFKGGSQPPKSEFIDTPQDGYIRLLQIRDFESDKYPVYIKSLEKWPKCESNDLLIARYGASLGRICSGKAGAYNVALVKILFDKEHLSRDWVKLFFKSSWFQDPLFLVSRSAQNGFNKNEVRPRPLPLPPLNEQRRIVAKIEELTAHSRKAREALDDVPRLIDRFRQSVLAAAFRGDLTADWREKNSPNESAQEFLLRIENHGNYSAKDRSSEIQINKEIPEGWRYVQVDTVGRVFLGRQRSPKNHQGPHMHSYVRSANITWNGWALSDVKEMNFDERDFKTYKLKRGDVLINEGSGSADEVGKPAIWNDEIPNCCFQNTLICVRPYEAALSKFLYFVLLHAAISKTFVDETRGINIHHIGKQRLAKFSIPLPPPDEQSEIIKRLENSLNVLRKVEEEYQAAETQITKLDRSILAKAFRGELVPQDPNDEPASVLLDRIRAEREKRETPKKKGRTSRRKAK